MEDAIFKTGDVVEAIPEMLQTIDYTNKPSVGSRYIVRHHFTGAAYWQYSLDHYPSGKDAYICIQGAALRLADLSKAICWACQARFEKSDVDLCSDCRQKYPGLLADFKTGQPFEEAAAADFDASRS